MPSDSAQHRRAVVQRAVEGPGRASGAIRHAAFDDAGLDGATGALVDKVARHAYRVTAADIGAARTAGVSEDEIFELAVCAALGHATRQLEAALTCLDAVTEETR
jgi:alkylhydroperoxidase family enzyme